MQYVRVYVNEDGVIEHVETSDKPLRSEPVIEVTEPIGVQEGMTREQIELLPQRKRVYNHSRFDFEAIDGKFKRAKDLRAVLKVTKKALKPSFVKGSGIKGVFGKQEVQRGNRGQS